MMSLAYCNGGQTNELGQIAPIPDLHNSYSITNQRDNSVVTKPDCVPSIKTWRIRMANFGTTSTDIVIITKSYN